MSFLQALFLAFVQGITEFLPISSSGHLVLFQKLFGFSETLVFFDVLLHLGSLGAVLVFFSEDVHDLVVNWRKNIKIWLLLIIGSIPAALFGFLFNKRIEANFDSIIFVGIAWIIFSFVLFSTKFIKGNGTKNKIKDQSWFDALTVGLFQAVALLPGISRSGSTITGGLFRKLSPGTAFKFSFLLSIPAILGAVILEARHGFEVVGLPLAFISAIVAGIVSYFSLILLQKILKSDKFYLFGFYCLGIGILTIIFLK